MPITVLETWNLPARNTSPQHYITQRDSIWKSQSQCRIDSGEGGTGSMRNRAAGRGTQSVLQFLTQHLGRACLITKWAVRHISRRFQRPNKSYMGTPSLAVPPHTYPSIPHRIQPCQWLTWNQAHKVVLIMSVYSVGLPGISFLWCGQLPLLGSSCILSYSWVLLGSSATTVSKRGWVFFCLWIYTPGLHHRMAKLVT